VKLWKLGRIAIFASLLCSCLMQIPSAAAAAAASAPQAPAASASAMADTEANADIKDRLKALEDKERASYAALIEQQRKSIDWWIGLLALLTTVIGVGGALVPFLMGRAHRDAAKAELEEVRQARSDIGKAREQAEVDAGHIKAERQKLLEYQEQDEASETPASGTAEIAQLAKEVEAAPSSSAIDKLRAKTIQLAQVAHPAEAPAADIYENWAAIARIEDTDALAQFNAGFWASTLAKKAVDEARSLSWWRRAGDHYRHALRLNPRLDWAANNWGIALNQEARILASNDLASARMLWKESGEKYVQALAIKADKHEAAYNWGNALVNEALALAPTDLSGARARWKLAGEKYAQALAIKVDKHEAAHNWGSALDQEARALAPTDLAEARALWKAAGEKYGQALAIKADKHEAAHNWGWMLDYEARALAPTDLQGARALWKASGEKYAQALAIKPDKHETAYNWGIALDEEARALAPIDLTGARVLWREAGEKYAQALVIKPDKHNAAIKWGLALDCEAKALAPTNAVGAQKLWQQMLSLLKRHAAMDNNGSSLVAYNLACAYSLGGDAAKAVEQLQSCATAGRLPSHWREDKDFDPIRQTPEYQAWVNQHSPD